MGTLTRINTPILLVPHQYLPALLLSVDESFIDGVHSNSLSKVRLFGSKDSVTSRSVKMIINSEPTIKVDC